MLISLYSGKKRFFLPIIISLSGTKPPNPDGEFLRICFY